MKLLAYVLLPVLIFLSLEYPVLASSHVPVGTWVYPALERLEAEGLIKSGILTNRPLSRKEMARLVKEAEINSASQDISARLKMDMERLKREFRQEIYEPDKTYVKPVDRIKIRYIYADETPYYLNNNNKGDVLYNGSNLRLGLSAMAGVGDIFSFFVNPELRYRTGYGRGDNDLELVEGYGALEFHNIELTVGREAMWWGPGYHGALLITDNARPLDLVRLSNPQPVLLPSILSCLGQFRFTIFATRLEKDRDIPNPYLAGIRLDFKPHPSVEIGLSRVALFGGGNRKVNLWNVFWARGENSYVPNDPNEPGDQIAGGDIKLIFPWTVQPAVIYAEVGGEDMAGIWPSHIGYVAGFHLPRLIGMDFLSLRGEYASNYVSGHPGVWYTHHIYTSGYTYNKSVIGHHIETKEKNFFMEASYATEGKEAVTLSYNGTENRISEGTKTNVRSISFAWEKRFDSFVLSLGYVRDRQTGRNGIPGNDLTSNSIWTGLELVF